jgi:ribosomal protein S6E (S10)
MPYYSVRITGGSDSHGVGVQARDLFGGREADYTGAGNFFYVQRNQKKEVLLANVMSFVGSEYKVDVKRISKGEYNWRQNR